MTGLSMTFQRKVPGYLGTTVIIPEGSKSSVRYIIHRFTNKTIEERWENSPEHNSLTTYNHLFFRQISCYVGYTTGNNSYTNGTEDDRVISNN